MNPSNAFANLVPPRPGRTSEQDVVLGAAGMGLRQTVDRLRQIGVGRVEAVATARRCGNDSQRFWAEVEAIGESRRSELRTSKLAAVLKQSGPVGLAGLGRDALRGLVRARAAAEAMRSWSGESLLVIGPTGAGKTALCVELVAGVVIGASAFGKWPEVVWCSGESLLLSQRRHPLGKGDSPEYERAVAADLLVIDDPDWIRSRDADELFALVCAARERRGMPMLVTSGATKTELVERYGLAVVRRILESSRDERGKPTGRVVDCHGDQDAEG